MNKQNTNIFFCENSYKQLLPEAARRYHELNNKLNELKAENKKLLENKTNHNTLPISIIQDIITIINYLKKIAYDKTSYYGINLDELEERIKRNSDNITLSDQLDIDYLINILKKSPNNTTELDIDLNSLSEIIKTTYKGINEFKNREKQILDCQKEIQWLTIETVQFRKMIPKRNDWHCGNRHYFIRLEDQLQCICCGASTIDYNISTEELDYLTECAKKQIMLIEDAKIEDLPFIQVRLEAYDKMISTYDPSEDDEENVDILDDLAHKLSLEVQRAHLLDLKKYDNERPRVNNPKYLTQEQVEELLKEIHHQQKTTNITEKEIRIKEYELLILSGAHIPTLLKEVKSEEEKDYLVTAYQNLSDYQYRIQSNYFKKEDDAIFYTCLTATPEINNRILTKKRW